jgi:cell division protein ZipA
VESLRWILLGAGLIFVLVIYLLGRSRRQRQHSIIDELEDDLPEFTAQSLDDFDEGVGEVRVVSRSPSDETDIDVPELDVPGFDVSDNDNADGSAALQDSAEESSSSEESTLPSDIIVLYILAKAERTLGGSQINSAAQAMGLRFGDMNIFHYRPAERSVFSLANMMEPGSFDEHTIHDLKTSGLTVFMQIRQGDPLDDLTEMLQRSYQLAGLLDARLCNHRRKPLTEQDAENYRTQVKNYVESRSASAEA